MKKLVLAALALIASIWAGAQEIRYTDAAAFPLFGKATEATSARYTRFPAGYKDISRKPLWDLSENSAGLYIRFRSDAPEIHARWVNHNYSMPHMTDVGVGGLDLYAIIGGEWRFVGSGFTWSGGRSQQRKIVGNMDPQMREYMMYLPLYDCLDSLSIGVPQGYVLEGPSVARPASGRPIVMYGTSILQGGCASRPGMVHTAILSRALDREVVNLGFSGNAQLDYEVAELIAKIPDPAVIVLDYVPNSGAALIRERGERFFRIIRDAHPDVPVVFVEDPTFPHSIVDKAMKEEIESKNAAQKELYTRLRKAGEKKIYYVGTEGMIGDDGEACVDGVHFTDLGMMRYADHMLPTLKKALKKR